MPSAVGKAAIDLLIAICEGSGTMAPVWLHNILEENKTITLLDVADQLETLVDSYYQCLDKYDDIARQLEEPVAVYVPPDVLQEARGQFIGAFIASMTEAGAKKPASLRNADFLTASTVLASKTSVLLNTAATLSEKLTEFRKYVILSNLKNEIVKEVI